MAAPSFTPASADGGRRGVFVRIEHDLYERFFQLSVCCQNRQHACHRGVPQQLCNGSGGDRNHRRDGDHVRNDVSIRRQRRIHGRTNARQHPCLHHVHDWHHRIRCRRHDFRNVHYIRDTRLVRNRLANREQERRHCGAGFHTCRYRIYDE